MRLPFFKSKYKSGGQELEESPILSDHEVNDQPEQMLLDQVPKICPVLQILSPYKIHVFRENTQSYLL